MLSGFASAFGRKLAKLKLRGGQTSISNPIEKHRVWCQNGAPAKGLEVLAKNKASISQAQGKHKASTRQAGAKPPKVLQITSF